MMKNSFIHSCSILFNPIWVKQRQTSTHTHIHTYSQFSPPSQGSNPRPSRSEMTTLTITWSCFAPKLLFVLLDLATIHLSINHFLHMLVQSSRSWQLFTDLPQHSHHSDFVLISKRSQWNCFPNDVYPRICHCFPHWNVNHKLFPFFLLW